MNQREIQRAGAPLVTAAPRWFAEFFQRSAAREFYFRELGADPDLCPDFAAFRYEYETECNQALHPLCVNAARLALEWRERMEITGRATEADAWRLVELAGYEVLPNAVLKSGAWVTRFQGRTIIQLGPKLEAPVEEVLGEMVGLGIAVYSVPALELDRRCDRYPVTFLLEQAMQQVALSFGLTWLDRGGL